MADAERARQYGTRTILFIDEIHRFNKAQQDAFLPHVEKGNIRADRRDDRESVVRDQFRFALALSCLRLAAAHRRSRSCSCCAEPSADKERGLGQMNLGASDEVLKTIASYTSGDARSAYNVLEVARLANHSPRSGTKRGTPACEITDADRTRRAAEAHSAL